MATVIIFNTVTNEITHIAEGLQSIASDLQVVSGIGWEWQGLTLDGHELIVVSDFADGHLPQIGDTLPNGLLDIKGQFIELAPTDYEQRLADLELMLVEILSI